MADIAVALANTKEIDNQLKRITVPVLDMLGGDKLVRVRLYAADALFRITLAVREKILAYFP